MQTAPDGLWCATPLGWGVKTIQVGSMMSDGGRHGAVEVPDGNFRVAFSDDSGPPLTPEHLFAGAYAACFHSAVESAAEKAHRTIPGLSVIAHVALAAENGQGDSTLAVELRAAMPGVARSEAEHLLHLAHQTCPYSKALRGRAKVTLTLD